FQVSIGLFGQLAPAVVYWYGGHHVIGGQASLPAVIASAMLLPRLFNPISQLLSVNITLLSSLALFERIFAYLDLKQERGDRQDRALRQAPCAGRRGRPGRESGQHPRLH